MPSPIRRSPSLQDYALDLSQDVHYGLRGLFRSPGFTLVAVLALGLGIGVNTAIFSLVNAFFFKPLPVDNQEQLVQIYPRDPNAPSETQLSYPYYLDLQEDNPVFSGLLSYQFVQMGLTQDANQQRVFGQIVTGNYFRVLGVRAALGRTFLPEEDRIPERYPVVVLSHAFWERLGGDRRLVGQNLTLNNTAFTVLGVAPVDFRGTDVGGAPDFWVPMMMYERVLANRSLQSRSNLWLYMLGRLKPGVTLSAARAAMNARALHLAEAFPTTDQDRKLRLVPLGESRLKLLGSAGNLTLVSVLLTVVVGMVLLIACANVANLVLARAASREQEIAVRLALGASRGRLTRQLLAESLLLGSLGGGVGLGLAVLTSRLSSSFTLPVGVALALDTRLDGRMLAFTLVLSLLSGLLFGLAPARQAARTQLVSALKVQMGNTGLSLRKLGLRQFLVIAQVALSLVLLVGASLFLRSLQNAQAINPGFQADRSVTLTLDLRTAGYTRERGQVLYSRLVERIQSLPGVEVASMAQFLPLSFRGSTLAVTVAGVTPVSKPIPVSVNTVSPGYLRTMGIPLLRGRDFTSQDTGTGRRVAMISEAMARRFWPRQDPVGERFTASGRSVTVVGVVADIMFRSLGEVPQPFFYMPLAQQYRPEVNLQVRMVGAPAALLATLRREVQEIDPGLAVFEAKTLSAQLDLALWPARIGAALLGTFGLLALVLATLGIYGLMAYSVNRRTRELGIRIALGARQSDILRLVVGQGMTLVLAGLILGLIGASVLSHLLASFLYGVSAFDPVTLGLTSLILGNVALVACGLPALKAARTNPLVALRYD